MDSSTRLAFRSGGWGALALAAGASAQSLSSYTLSPTLPRAGEEFRIEVLGGSMDALNSKIMLVDGAQTTTCGLNTQPF